jgi:hypothetical protein
MITKVLHLHPEGDKRSFEIYLNDNNEIFIGERNDEDPYSSWLTLSYDDWKEVKKYIDQQFKEIL